MNASITDIATITTIIVAVGTIISSFLMAWQGFLMRKQNEISVTQNAESLTLQTKLALYKERKEFIIKLEEAYNLNISEVLQSFKKNDEEISKFLAIQYKIDMFMGNYTNNNLSEEDFQKAVKESKEKALKEIKQIYETTKMQDYYNAPFYFIERPSKYLLNNLITESGLLFEAKEVEEIKKCFQLLNEKLDKFKDFYHCAYLNRFATWFKLARSMSLYCMYRLVINNEDPDAKYNELLKSWEEMVREGGKIADCKYYGFTKKESEYYIPPITPLIELLRKEIKLLP